MIKKILLIILLVIALYYTFIRDFIYVPSDKIYYYYKLSESSIIYDVTGKPLYSLYEKENRILTYSDSVPEIINKCLFSSDYISEFMPYFYNLNNRFIEDSYDYYYNCLINKIYMFDKSLVSKFHYYVIKTRLKNDNKVGQLKRLTYNTIRFDDEIYGLNSFAVFKFSKTIDKLNLSEIIYLLSSINFNTLEKLNSIEREDRQKNILNYLLEKKLITNKQFYDCYNHKVKLSPFVVDVDDDIDNLLNVKTGISDKFIKLYIYDYLFTKIKLLKTKYNGYHIFTYIDKNLLKEIEKDLRLFIKVKSNKLLTVYKKDGNQYLFVGFIGLPKGKKYIDKVDDIKKKYSEKNVYFKIMQVVRPTYLHTFRQFGIILKAVDESKLESLGLLKKD